MIDLGARFDLVSHYQPTGDQPQAIQALTRGLREKKRDQVLLGVTGSGKTFTIANVIAEIGLPTLVISHNKTLAAQLYGEFKGFFPHNAVEYFVSYYDYYQPEAFVPSTNTYIAKDASINDDIDRLRVRATSSLMTRQDVIVVSSVSCIYGLGSPENVRAMMIELSAGDASSLASAGASSLAGSSFFTEPGGVSGISRSFFATSATDLSSMSRRAVSAPAFSDKALS